MNGQIVEDDHRAGFKFRGQLRFDVDIERVPVHGALEDPWRDEGTGGQARDEGLGSPPSERSLAEQALANGAAAPQSCHVGLDGRLVDKDQPVRQPAHARLPPIQPFTPGLPEGGALTFLGGQPFLYEKSALNGGKWDCNSVGVLKRPGQFPERDVRFRPDDLDQEIHMRRELADRAGRTALPLWSRHHLARDDRPQAAPPCSR